MRKVFIKKLIQAAQIDPSIYLITGDLGFSVLEEFKQNFEDRFINAGIAEQNMIGVAAGLAMSGKNVFVYSIVPFVTMRCFEQVRVDICYQNLPVKLIGVGGGLSYGTSATTHHAIEDVAIMCCLPNMSVISPGSKLEVEKLSSQVINLKGPAYFRISNNEELVTYPEDSKIEFGKAVEILPNDENLIIATGNALDLGWQVCKELQKNGINIGLVSMPTVKPLDDNYLLSKQKTLKFIFTIEEHNVIGGLGETISSFILQNFERKIVFKSFGIPDIYCHEIGSRDYLKEKMGLSVEKISYAILEKFSLVRNEQSNNLVRATYL